MSGAFLISRDLFQNEIWRDAVKFRIFFYLVGNAVYSHDGVKVGGIHVQRGQFLRSLRYLQDDLIYIEGKGNKRHKYHLSTLSRKIKCLVNEGRIKVKSTENGTLFTIVNYEHYQGLENYGKTQMERKWNGNGTDTERLWNKNKKVEEGSKKVKKDKEKIIREIKDLRVSFSPDLIQIIDSYWTVIKKTRKTNTIAYSVILKTMKQWIKYEPVVIKYALKKHIEVYDDGEKTEKYTLAIMRNTTPEKAKDELNQKVTQFRPRKGAPNYDEPPRSDSGGDKKLTHVRLYK